jgi:hypothetical protein
MEKNRIKNRKENHERYEPPKHPLEQVGAPLNPALATAHQVFQTGSANKLREDALAQSEKYQVCLCAARPCACTLTRCVSTTPSCNSTAGHDQREADEAPKAGARAPLSSG